MAQHVTMPQLGSTMEEGTILRWRKQEGEAVRKGEVLLEVMTDKASMEVEAECDGILRKILAPIEATVPIRQPIAILGAANEPIEHLLASPNAASAAANAPSEGASRQAKEGAGERKVAVSPRARRAADEHGVSISALAGQGTGPGGRIIERDVLAWLERQKTAQETPVRATPLAARMADDLGIDLNDLATGLPGSRVRREDVLRYADVRRPARETAASETEDGVRVLAFGGLRKRIAENVSRSAFTAPHVTLTLEVDMTAAAELRARLLPEVEKVYGTRLTYTDLLVKAVARALEEHPRLNAALVGEEIRLYTHKNIGVAVALDEGLIVPVVRRVETKSLGAVSAELSALVARVRAGSYTPEDLAEGTFTITNLGAFGIDLFDPIILAPQAAILGVGRIADKPVVIDKQIAVRSLMNLCLSFDHRVLDGAPAARFLQHLKELLENPEAILV
ncbi:MAG TPA: dihydrolipoamide acetyltransferase family protein [Chthonomonadaceae bacterium]|nr:dihydrolipoamide acetyltransferase family protein [Chthonomonadaceae bacterium]